MGVFQSNPKLLEDYLRSREPRHLLAPVQHQDFQGQLGFKGLLPLPWKDEGMRPPNSLNVQQQQQMSSQQPVWFQQQLVGGKLELLPASLVKQQEQLLPATLQQQRHVVGGAQLEDNQ